MFDLRINGKTAVIKPGNKIKLTRENQLTEDAGDWSLDVILPLNGCPENLAIFGNSIHRPEPALSDWIDAKLPFTLLAPPLNVSGHAIVTNVTNEEVKVQLLGGKTDFKQTLYDKVENLKVSKLDLGEVLSGVGMEGNPYGISTGDDRMDRILTAYYHAEEQLATANGLYSGTDKPMPLLWTDPEQYDATFLPVYSKTDNARINEKIWIERIYWDNTTGSYITSSHKFISPAVAAKVFNGNLPLESNYYDKARYTPMPFLYKILERVFSALGYAVIENHIRGTWMERLVMANVIQTTDLAKMLPDWTVREFLDECRNFFSIEYEMTGQTVRIVRTKEHYHHDNVKVCHIEQASDDTEAELKHDEQVRGYLLKANVQYKNLSRDLPIVSIPKEILKEARLQYVEGKNEVPGNFNRISGVTLYHDDAEGSDPGTVHIYALMKGNGSSYRATEVDLCRPHIGHGTATSPESRDIDIELRIRPCLMEYLPFSHIRYTPDWDFGESAGDKLVPYDNAQAKKTPMVMTDGGFGDPYAWNLNDELTENSPTDLRPDMIEVIYIDDSSYIYGHPYPGTIAGINMTGETGGTGNVDVYLGEGLSYMENEDGFYTTSNRFGRQKRFNLSAVSDSSQDIANMIFSQAINLDTRLVRKIDFFDNLNDYDPSAIYIIRGRRYICQKIKITITQDGLAKKKTGYFYEWNG